LKRFLVEDEASKTLSLFEGASETKRISKSSLKNWVVRTGQQMVFMFTFSIPFSMAVVEVNLLVDKLEEA
jgi:hypothetical protein